MTNYTYAAFSLLRKGQSCRGYLSYTVEGVDNHYCIYSNLDYLHQTGWLQFPAKTAKERLEKGYGTNEPFISESKKLFFYPEGINIKVICNIRGARLHSHIYAKAIKTE